MTEMTHRELKDLTTPSLGNPPRHSRVTDELQRAFSAQFKESTEAFLGELKLLFEQTLDRLCGHCTVLGDNMHSCMEQITNSMSEMSSKITEEFNKKESSMGYETREAQMIKNNLSKYWKNELNNRKTAYMKNFRSMKLAELYKEISQDENPFVPKEFRITVSESTSQEEKDLRSRQSIQHLKDEIEVLLVRSTNFKKQFEETDTKVGTFLEEQTSDLTVRKCLQTLWKNDCQNEESTTHKIWENKESSHRSTYKKEKEEETIHTLIINQETSVSPGNSNNIIGKIREEQASPDQFYPNQNIQPNFNQFNPNQNVNLYPPQQFHYGNGFNRRGNNMSGNYNQGQRRGYKPKFK